MEASGQVVPGGLSMLRRVEALRPFLEIFLFMGLDAKGSLSSGIFPGRWPMV